MNAVGGKCGDENDGPGACRDWRLPVDAYYPFATEHIMQDRMWLAPQSERRRAPDFAERKGFDGNVDRIQHLIQVHEFHMSFD